METTNVEYTSSRKRNQSLIKISQEFPPLITSVRHRAVNGNRFRCSRFRFLWDNSQSWLRLLACAVDQERYNKAKQDKVAQRHDRIEPGHQRNIHDTARGRHIVDERIDEGGQATDSDPCNEPAYIRTTNMGDQRHNPDEVLRAKYFPGDHHDQQCQKRRS